jgi:putative ABC transport system substrate-binding protein
MTIDIRRREFVAALSGAVAAWPSSVRAQRSQLPVVAVINGASADLSSQFEAAFQNGLAKSGYAQGNNVIVEYHWMDGQFHRLRTLIADLVRRRVSVIATPVSMAATLVAKDATRTIPIVFGISQDPVKFGIVASFARPGGNATGVNFLNRELDTKRLEFLHQLVPAAVRIAVLLNPANSENAESSAQNVRLASRGMGLHLSTVYASTSDQIDAVFANFAQDRPDALVVTGDSFFTGRREQLATLAARARIPAAYSTSQIVEAGGLLSYGSNISDTFYEVGVYTGRILQGAKPAELAVLQSSKFVLAINMKAAMTLGIMVTRMLLAFANEIIE